MNYSFFRQLAIAFDQFINVLAGGWADETMSARGYRAWLKGRIFGRAFMPPIDWLFSWQKQDEEANRAAGKELDGHCERAFWKEKIRRDNAPEYRD